MARSGVAVACGIMRFIFLYVMLWWGLTTTTVVMGEPSNPLGLHFAETHGHDMVLQRAPARAVVSGHLTLRYSMEAAAQLNLPTVQVSLWRHESATSTYELETIQAHVGFPGQAYDSKQRSLLVWSFQALMPPMPPSTNGHHYTVMARAHLPLGMDDASDPTGQDDDHNPLLHENLYEVIFGDVWYCSGQSNMALPLQYTKARNSSLEAVLAGTYDHVRIHSLQTNMNPFQKWAPPKDAVEQESFMKFSSTCWYFMEGLTHELYNMTRNNINDNDVPLVLRQSMVPIGLIHTAWGGSKIEDWLDDDSIQKCNPANQEDGSLLLLSRSERPLYAQRYQDAVIPYKDLTIKGWIWYQGENNMENNTVLGNSLYHSGYSCLMVQLIQSWRSLWSSTSSSTRSITDDDPSPMMATDPLAPFGVVALPTSGSVGTLEIGTMRVAQTGGFGVLPNPSMPHTFLVQAYDQDDPMRSLYGDCWTGGCCPSPTSTTGTPACNDATGPKPKTFPCEECANRCSAFCADVAATSFNMGPIHPRTKQTLGWRLGLGAAQTGHGVSLEKPRTGPTLAGCMLKVKYRSTRNKVMPLVTIRFNEALLGQDVVEVQAYNQTNRRLSKLEVLVDSTKFCLQKSPVNNNICIDDGYGNSFEMSGDSNQGWVPVNIVPESGPLNVQRRRRSGPKYHHEITADLSGVQGSISAIRYAWQGDCCDATNGEPCPLGSCPIISYPSGLPANPFVAKITKGKCECLPPQECNAFPVPTTESQILLDTVLNQGYYWTYVSVLCSLILALLALSWILLGKQNSKETSPATTDDDWVAVTAPTNNDDDDDDRQGIALPDIT
uniref:Sialate O-acetylesterase domain-containing protein n=1 Tax=Attheya septentrionalis TaxID=420275 RepID=A0A7S2UD85_9STRA